MRTIGIDAHVLTGKFQGSRTVLRRLLQVIGSQPRDMTFAVYSEDPQAVAVDLAAPDFTYPALESRSATRRLLFDFPRLFKRDGVDIGVFHYITPPFSRTPDVAITYDILPLSHGQYFPLLFRIRSALLFTLALIRAPVVVTCSYATKAEIARYYPSLVSKVVVVPLGPSFSEEVYSPLPDQSASPSGLTSGRYVLAVGRIERRKNIALLSDAFLKAGLVDVHLVVVGSRDMQYDWTPPEDDRVHLVSGLDDAGLAELFHHAGLFIYPSVAEGFGIPLLDATLFGLPVIASNRTSMPEVGGDLVEYFDPLMNGAVDHLAGLIRGHFTDAPIARPTNAQRAAQWKKYSWEACANQFLQVLEKVGLARE